MKLSKQERIFLDAQSKWDAQHEAGAFSLPPDEGITAIFQAKYIRECNYKEHWKEMLAFRKEALAIKRRLENLGRRGLVFSGLRKDELYEVLDDPQFSSLVMIGHGDLMGLRDDEGGFVDWRHVSKAASHLKLGTVIQRFCGGYGGCTQLGVPFGAFAVSDQRNVIAPVGKMFTPESDPTHEKYLRPVFTSERISLSDARSLSPRYDTSKISEEDTGLVSEYAAD